MTVIYIHIPKCAGSTALGILHPLFKDGEVYRQRGSVVQEKQVLADMSIQDKAQLALVCGHMCYGWHDVLNPGQPYTYVTLLRDPVNRVLSFCRYIERSKWHTMHSVMNELGRNWGRFVASGRCRSIDNGMVRILCGDDEMLQSSPEGDMRIPFGEVRREHLERAIAHLETFSVVGISEEFGTFLHLLRANFGWKIPLHFRNQNSQGRLCKEDYSIELNRIINRRTQLDLELYDWVLKKGGYLHEAITPW